MYGRRKYGTKRATVSYRGSRFGSRFGGKVAYRKKSRYTNRMKFAMVGYRRNTEKKYSDRTYVGDRDVIASGVGSPAGTSNGAVFTSTHWGEYDFRSGGGTGGTALAVSNDMLKGLATGNDVRTRIGNKVKGQYVKGALTFTAAYTDATLYKDQGGETAVDLAANPSLAYLRTTIRMCIVKDVQVNSADANIYWNSVFENTGIWGAGVHSELKIENMGRFIVLQDKTFTLDADDPQKTVQFMVSGSQIGSVRYNGPNANSLTDKGIYMIWSAFTVGAPSETGLNFPATTIKMAGPVGHSRFCFTDD